MKYKLLILLLFSPLFLQAEEGGASALNKKEFSKYWVVESQSPDYKVSFLGDTLELVSPQGLTLWRKEKMTGDGIIEYDACVMNEGKEGDRLSDLNCFWKASDAAFPNDIMKRKKSRNAVFANCYALQTYYVGYGGNHNTTTRFRRYKGNEAGITDTAQRPPILVEYLDSAHLLVPNRWYHIQLVCKGNQVCYYINGERLVDFRDPEPLEAGWFGFRTTSSRTRIANFTYRSLGENDSSVSLNWIGEAPSHEQGITWGVPFAKGTVSIDKRPLLSVNEQLVPAAFFPLAYWEDGSVKWGGFSALIPCDTIPVATTLRMVTEKEADKQMKGISSTAIEVEETSQNITVKTGDLVAYFSKSGNCVMDSLILGGTRVSEAVTLVCETEISEEQGNGVRNNYFQSQLKQVTVEQNNNIRTVVKIEGVHQGNGREWLPFVLRCYLYAGSEQIKMVHSFVFDGDANVDFIKSLGIRFTVPFREELYNRHIAFSGSDNGVWSEPVQPLVGRTGLYYISPEQRQQQQQPRKRSTNMADYPKSLQQQQIEGTRIPNYDQFDKRNQELLDQWASWNDYRLSQLTDNAFSVRKRTHDTNPWIGTFTSSRSSGCLFAGDVSGGLAVCLQDFWQSYPTTLEVRNACSDAAQLTVWLWSPEGEAMDLRHYDNRAHGLLASYEDVQEGLSTPYGIARTHVLQLLPSQGYKGKKDFSETTKQLSTDYQLICTPRYLHEQRAFGVWSLPDSSTTLRANVENRLSEYVDFYKQAIEEHKWYGFWNYGDVMHAYDAVRHEWMYDIGGYAWDNTELASNMWLWYNFLRTGDEDLWRMSVAMTRHTAEVDVYHLGDLAGLGSRHNVSHWGCGAKEARISQAAWNRFYYYLTADERCGDLMHEVTDADQKLYTLDPMRLAQPREDYPCTAPARLRIGPDWIAYAGNWMTEWERTGNTLYRDKIIAGMKSIAALPHGIFTGPKALGYDPATGIISHEGDTSLTNTNHLLPLMGGFEIMNEMMEMIKLPEWERTWLDLAANYRNGFKIPRLPAYAAYHLSDATQRDAAWKALLSTWGSSTAFPAFPLRTLLPPEVPVPQLENPFVSTNSVATWSLDAIYLLEVCPKDN